MTEKEAEMNAMNNEMFDPESAVWTFRARPDPNSEYEGGVVDGDTYHLEIDLGFRTVTRQSIRSVYLDTAEIFSPKSEEEKEIADEQKAFVQDWFEGAESFHDGNWPLLIRTRQETGAYGRWLAEVFDRDQNMMSYDLLEEYGDEYVYEDVTDELLQERFNKLRRFLNDA